ncbi:hypothetical protein R1flu_003307 [Riccia fluitans]|uniref:SANTA domain-containing protein n=1 Tax=Riccia fluitans TaxID=41844 RepID=A0ABD1YC36_9MARC
MSIIERMASSLPQEARSAGNNWRDECVQRLHPKDRRFSAVKTPGQYRATFGGWNDGKRSCETTNGNLGTPSHHSYDRLSSLDELGESLSRVCVNCGDNPLPSGVAREAAGKCGREGHGPEHVGDSEGPAEEDRCRHRGVPEAGQRCSKALCNCLRCGVMRSSVCPVGEKGFEFDNQVHVPRGGPSFLPLEASILLNNFGRKSATMSRNSTTSATRTSSKTTPIVLVHSQAKKKKVSFFGWFLKRPSVAQKSDSALASSGPQQVAIGGYKSDRMRESDYFESGPIVERHERWRLQTSDGMEVALMGVINVAKSVENGFPSTLVQCFMIGFPTVWKRMISMHCAVSPGSRSPNLPSSFSGASTERGQKQDTQALSCAPEADPVRAVLSSPLFKSPAPAGWTSDRHLSPVCRSAAQTGSVPAPTPVQQSDTNGKDPEKQTGNYLNICPGAPKAEDRIELEVPLAGEIPTCRHTLLEDSEHPGTPVTGLLSAAHKPKDASNRFNTILDTPETRVSKQIERTIDWREFLNDGSFQVHEEEAQNRVCDNVTTVHLRRNEVVILEKVCIQYSCLGDAHLKRTCPCSGEAGSECARFSSNETQDRESKADVPGKGNSTEDLSSSRVGREKNSGCNCGPELAHKDTSVTGKRPLDESNPDEMDPKIKRLCDTGKRPLEELNPEDVGRESKRLCETNSLSSEPERHPDEEMSDILLEGPPVTTPDACLNVACIPCTPLLVVKKRPRIETESPCVQQELGGEGIFYSKTGEPPLEANGAEGLRGEDIFNSNAAEPLLEANGAEESRDEDFLISNVGEPMLEANGGKESRDEDVLISDAGEPVLEGNRGEEREGFSDLNITTEGLTSAESKGSAGPSVVPSEESVDVVMEPVDETCADAGEDTSNTTDTVSSKGKEKIHGDFEATHAGLSFNSKAICQQPSSKQGSSSKHAGKPAKRKTRYYTGPKRRKARMVGKRAGQGDSCEGTKKNDVVVLQKKEELVRRRRNARVVNKNSITSDDGEKWFQAGEDGPCDRIEENHGAVLQKHKEQASRRRNAGVVKKSSHNPDSGGGKCFEARVDDPCGETEENLAAVLQKHEEQVGCRRNASVVKENSLNPEGGKKYFEAGEGDPCDETEENHVAVLQKHEEQIGSRRNARGVRKSPLSADGGKKCSEDDPCDKTEENHRAVLQTHEGHVSRRNSHGKDSEGSSERPGERINGESRGEPEELVRTTRSSRKCSKTADAGSVPSVVVPSKSRTQIARPPPTGEVPDKTGTMVTEAFGLKRSRHGRVIVPRLASWLSQSIKYDMDGSIIGISEGFEAAEEELGTGRRNFKPPSDKHAPEHTASESYSFQKAIVHAGKELDCAKDSRLFQLWWRYKRRSVVPRDGRTLLLIPGIKKYLDFT